MLITWYGQSCLKIVGSLTTIIIEPFDSSIGLKSPRLVGDIIIFSGEDKKVISKIKNSLDKAAFAISGAGEYEVKGTFVHALYADNGEDAKKSDVRNTIYRIDIENITLAHLGYLDHKLSGEQLDHLEKIDILFIPVGGHGTLNGKQATDLISQIEPRVIVPMHYSVPGLKKKLDSLDGFCKEIGICPKEHLPKLKIVKKDLPPDEMKVILLEKA